MAVDYTSHTAAWHTRIDIALSGSTLRYADRDLAMDDDTLYEGRLLSMSSMNLALQSLQEPIFVAPSIRLVFDNADDVIRTSIDANAGWAGKTITVWFGQGTAVADYEVRFTGTVRFPGGIDWDDKVVRVDLDHVQSTARAFLPSGRFFASDYPDIESKSSSLVKPLIYGDFRSGIANGETVPCYMTDDSAGGQVYTFSICEGPIEAIEAVYRTGVDITAQCSSFNLTDATFVWTAPGGSDYDEDVDEISCNMAGRTSGGSFLERPDDVMEDLFTIAGISYESNPQWASAISAGDKVRRWMGLRRSIWTWIAELANESFVDIGLEENGDLKPFWRLVGVPEDLDIYREVDLIARNDGGREFGVRRDPEKIYANEITADYELRPARWDTTLLDTSESFAANLETDDATAQTEVGQTVSRRLKMRWFYRAPTVQDRSERDLLAFSAEPEYVDITTGPRGLAKKPTDQFSLIYSKFEQTGTVGTAFQVRGITLNYDTLTAQIVGWNIDDLAAKRYQADGSPAWSGATAYDQEVMGFYEQNAEQIYF